MKDVRLVKMIWNPPRYVWRPDFSRMEPPLLFSATLVFFTVSYYTQLGVRLKFLGAIRHELLLGVVLLTMSILSIVHTRPLLASQQKLIAGTLLFIMVQAIQVPLAVDVQAANYTFTEYVLKQALYCLFIVCLVRSPRQFFGVVGAFVFSMFWVYREAVRGLISGSLVWISQGIYRLHGAVPRYHHPNGLSLAACMVLPFIFYLIPVFRRYLWVTLFFVATIVLASLCIINTGSRAGYVGLLALIPYWILDGPGRLRRLAIAVLIGIIVIPAVPDQYKGRFESITGEEVAGRSREARHQILIDAWEVFKKYPFGTGLQGFQVVRMEMFGRHQDTHNLYAQIATHLGIQGIIVFGLFAWALFHSQIQVLAQLRRAKLNIGRQSTTLRSRDRRASAYYIFEINLLIAMVRGLRMLLYFLLVNGLFAHTLYHVIWYFIAGLTIASGHIAAAIVENEKRVVRLEHDNRSQNLRGPNGVEGVVLTA